MDMSNIYSNIRQFYGSWPIKQMLHMMMEKCDINYDKDTINEVHIENENMNIIANFNEKFIHEVIEAYDYYEKIDEIRQKYKYTQNNLVSLKYVINNKLQKILNHSIYNEYFQDNNKIEQKLSVSELNELAKVDKPKHIEKKQKFSYDIRYDLPNINYLIALIDELIDMYGIPEIVNKLKKQFTSNEFKTDDLLIINDIISCINYSNYTYIIVNYNPSPISLDIYSYTINNVLIPILLSLLI